MRQVMVRYKVKADRAAENESYIKKVFAQLERDRPAGVHYASFKLEDGVSFIHVAATEPTESGGNPLTELSEFKAFSANIKDRCEELPVTTTLNEIGSYEFLSS